MKSWEENNEIMIFLWKKFIFDIESYSNTLSIIYWIESWERNWREELEFSFNSSEFADMKKSYKCYIENDI